VQVEGIKSDSVEEVKGVPHGSVLGPLLFTIWITLYCSVPTKQKILGYLQSTFDIIQACLYTLKLV